jgi:hypothetical protein
MDAGMKLILVVVLGLVGVFLAVILVLFLLIARNLKSMASAVARATSLVEAVEERDRPSLTPPKRSMKEIFAVLPSLLRRADTLRKN